LIVLGGTPMLALVLFPGLDQERLEVTPWVGLVGEQSPLDRAGSLPEMPQLIGAGEERVF
jgi:hypothetical protein